MLVSPQEQGGCGTLNLVQGAVRSAPRGLVLCLGWGQAPPPDADLAAVLAALPARLDPRAAFPRASLAESLLGVLKDRTRKKERKKVL